MRTPTSAAERGAALLEAVIALALAAMLAAAGFSAFTRLGRATAAAETRLRALALAENAVEEASAPAFLTAARDAPRSLQGAHGALVWRREAAREGDGAPALVRLTVVVGDPAAPLARLDTLRLAP